jgi:hypothetical protein
MWASGKPELLVFRRTRTTLALPAPVRAPATRMPESHPKVFCGIALALTLAIDPNAWALMKISPCRVQAFKSRVGNVMLRFA